MFKRSSANKHHLLLRDITIPKINLNKIVSVDSLISIGFATMYRFLIAAHFLDLMEGIIKRSLSHVIVRIEHREAYVI